MTAEKRAYDEAAERLCAHTENCRSGCHMYKWECAEGQELLAAENAAWGAYQRAKTIGRAG